MTHDARRTTHDIYAVILVGGKGKRLRPLSTDARPKAFLSVTADRKTVFANTLDRIRPFVGERNLIVVANKAHAKLVARDFAKARDGQILFEPVSRNTAPAIALAANRLMSDAGDAIMMVLPSDQYVSDKERYIDSLRQAVEFARKKKDAILTIGVRPRSASTQFGYIRTMGGSGGVKKVVKFIEKPDLKTAKSYVKNGQYLWNTGVFIFRASTILQAIKKFAPKISAILGKLDKEMNSYRHMPDISIDYAVMESSGGVWCVEGRYGWSDIGNFKSLISILRRESRRFIVKDGKVTAIQ